MEDKNIKKFSERKVGGAQLALPLVAIAMFMLVSGGVTYAYFSFKSISTNNTSYMNTTWPGRCTKTVTITKSDCAITSNTDNRSASANTTDSVITSYEMLPARKGNQAAQAVCSVTVSVNGCPNDTCTFNVGVANGTTAYSQQVANEFTGTLSGDATKAETAMSSLIGTDLATGQTITVATANNAVSKTYNLTLKFYNRDGEQNGLQSATAETTYRQYLKVTAISCNMDH